MGGFIPFRVDCVFVQISFVGSDVRYLLVSDIRDCV